MKRVLQEDPTGCGIACLAMLAGLSYKEVKAICQALPKFQELGHFYTRPEDLRSIAVAIGVTLSKRYLNFTGWDRVADLAIVAINYKIKPEGASWHWVIFSRVGEQAFVVDPDKSIVIPKRLDFSNIKAKWFIPVVSTNSLL
jgi:ABC-type bacteriocin/lantibiotic exporter with double-glycine peptidase domain